MSEYKDYGYSTPDASHMHARFMPVVFRHAEEIGVPCRVLDVGCGNGYLAGQFLHRGCPVVGIDLSEQGVSIARKAVPQARFEVLPADQHLLESLGEAPFDLVVSTEVVEHLYAPRPFVKGCFSALRPGGRFVCTTPYHGYFKNLVLSVLGKWDAHANPLWDGGHIKLWSRRTIFQLLGEAGFTNLRFTGVGRAPFLWMTMVIAGDRPRP